MRGSIPLADYPGGLNLRATLESGQSYVWRRLDGTTYGEGSGDGWYYAVPDGEFLKIRVREDEVPILEWEATTDADALLHERLRLGDDLHAIRATAPDDTVVQRAYDRFWGLRIVSDPFFPTLISFICSAQMRVQRIHEMQNALRETYGPAVTVDGETYHGFPTPETLAATTETALRDLGLGYRAPYVQ
ncbi:MAG: DNA-3-methyladenine glycosylase, partial [Halobacteriaceae archaeon]